MSRITTPTAWSHANKAYVVKNSALLDLSITGTYVPPVSRLLFNVGEKTVKSHVDEATGKKIVDESRKTLTTIVFWADGTRTVVTNSEHDPIEFEPDGKTPTKACYERGFVYAFFKRCISKYATDEAGQLTLKAEGLGRILNEIMSKAYDCNAVLEKKNEKKNMPKQMELPLKTEKKKRPSLAQCAVDLSENIKDLKSTIAELKSGLDASKQA